MINWTNQIIKDDTTIKAALTLMDQLGIVNNDLFVINESRQLVGSLSDGDIRRALLGGKSLDESVTSAMFTTPVISNSLTLSAEVYAKCKKKNIRFVPVVDEQRIVLFVVDIEDIHVSLPIDAILMAGGKGTRLLPLTEKTPKPLLKVGNKPIIEHNIDRLVSHGVSNFYVSIHYLGDMLKDYFKDGSPKGIKISYIEEEKPMGTIGSVKLEKDYSSDALLIMNSDLLTDINFSDFYKAFTENNADMAIAVSAYTIDVPYAVLEISEENFVLGLSEKPQFKYHSNAGIYILKKELLDLIPEGEFFDITDLIGKLIEMKKKIFAFPILGYWLDIGKMDDYRRAQEDIKYLKF